MYHKQLRGGSPNLFIQIIIFNYKSSNRTPSVYVTEPLFSANSLINQWNNDPVL